MSTELSTPTEPKSATATPHWDVAPLSATELIEKLDLLPHPEGGWFRETYRSALVLPEEDLLLEGIIGPRNASTAFYFLLERGQRTLFHKLHSDEIWHFHTGGPMDLVELLPDGQTRATTIGPDLREGHVFQHVIKAGTWFGGRPSNEHDYTLVSCTTAPGIDFEDVKFGDRDVLLQTYPLAHEWIEMLTPIKLA